MRALVVRITSSVPHIITVPGHAGAGLPINYDIISRLPTMLMRTSGIGNSEGSKTLTLVLFQ